MKDELAHYAELLGEIKARIGQAQTKAALSANREMLRLYWDIGRLITARQEKEGWGGGVLCKLAQDLKCVLSGVKGFSHRNLKRMTQFYREYPSLFIGQPEKSKNRCAPPDKQISQQPVAEFQRADTKSLTSNGAIGPPVVAQLNQDLTTEEIKKTTPFVQPLVAQLPWAHNIVMIQSVKDLNVRLWYMQQTPEQGWSRNVLYQMIKGEAHVRQGKAVTNFETSLPAPQSDLALQTLKDPYIFDFLTLDASQ